MGRATKCYNLPIEQKKISIHALRGEGDKAHEKDYNAVFDFNPRPPWGGRRKNLRLRQIKQRFQSTPSVGRATLVVGIIYGFIKISIHALRGEGDDLHYGSELFNAKFQSTPSVGRATRRGLRTIGMTAISIHALRGEGDEELARLKGAWTSISIHALRGEGDTNLLTSLSKNQKFQSTPSVGRATCGSVFECPDYTISIHALRGEGDMSLTATMRATFNFNPRPPWGGRRATSDFINIVA